MRLLRVSPLLLLLGHPTRLNAGLADLLTDSAPKVIVTPVPPNTNAVQKVPLNSMAVTRVPVTTNRLTTIRFPNPVSDLISVLVSTEPHPDAQFLLVFHPGDSFFSIRALRPAAATTLNVVWKSQTFVFEVQESSAPWYSVVMTPTSHRPTDPVGSDPEVSESEMRTRAHVMETAINYHSLAQTNPSALLGVTSLPGGAVRRVDDLVLQLDEILQFTGEEMLVFKVTIQNPGRYPRTLLPGTIVLQVAGQNVPILRVDHRPQIPARGETTAWVLAHRRSCGPPTVLRTTADFAVTLTPSKFPEPRFP